MGKVLLKLMGIACFSVGSYLSAVYGWGLHVESWTAYVGFSVGGLLLGAMFSVAAGEIE